MVECQLPKLKVAGSIPVSRSSNHKRKAAASTSNLTLRLFDFGMGLWLRFQAEARDIETFRLKAGLQTTAPSTRGI